MPKVTKQQAGDFLKQRVSAVIASCTEAGPQAATVFYAIDDHLNLYFFTRLVSRKYRNLMENPRLAMVVTDEKNQITVQMEGEAEKVESPDGFTRAAHLLSEAVHKYPSHWPVLMGKMINGHFVIDDDIAIFKLSMKWLRWAEFKDTSKEDFDDCFTEVDL